MGMINQLLCVNFGLPMALSPQRYCKYTASVASMRGKSLVSLVTSFTSHFFNATNMLRNILLTVALLIVRKSMCDSLE